MIYRREIDGLRAVAVIPVMLFHAGVAVFSGGYVGVDVFFVISGYLITSILIAELEKGDFSIARFYERRARRILPALVFVMLCCIPFAWRWMLPLELKDFSKSLVAVTWFASNILFWREDGYFAPAAELKPLLHTWSLAVEEQYYLLFPLFLALFWRFGRNRVVWSIAGLAVISLLVSEWGWRHNPSANFYLAPSRAWELFAGSLCAFWLSRREQPTNSAASLAGLALIVFGIFRYDDATPFPSLYALAPVLGTALIILFGGAGSLTARLLGLPVFVGIGLISYSAYLWHQPLFAFARLRSIGEPSLALMLGLAGLALLLAWFSWRFIERPFRKGRDSVLPTRRAVFMASGAAAALMTSLGVIGMAQDGFPTRLSADKRRIAATAIASPMRDKCHFDLKSRFSAAESCVYFGKTPTIAVYGNSHGVELAYALATALRPSGRLVAHFTVSQCQPIFTTFVSRYCNDFYQSRLEYLTGSATITTVVLAFRYENGGSQSARALVGMANLLAASGKTVVLVLQAPTLERPVLHYLRPWAADDRENLLFERRQAWQDKSRDMTAAMSRLDPNVRVVDAADAFCEGASCYAIRDGNALYFDDNHMSLKGAERVAAVIARTLP